MRCSCGLSFERADLLAACEASGHVLKLERAEFALSRAELEACGKPSPCRGCGMDRFFFDRRDVGGGLVPLSVRSARQAICQECKGQGTRCARCAGWGLLYVFTNHFVDCPDRESFRKPKPKKGGP